MYYCSIVLANLMTRFTKSLETRLSPIPALLRNPLPAFLGVFLASLVLYVFSWINPAFAPPGYPYTQVLRFAYSLGFALLLYLFLCFPTNLKRASFWLLWSDYKNSKYCHAIQAVLAIVLLSYYFISLFLLAGKYSSVYMYFKAIGVFTSHHLLSDLNIIDTSIECLRQGLSVHSASDCNSMIPMNYVMAWSHIFDYFGLGGPFNIPFLVKHPIYWLVIVIQTGIAAWAIYVQRDFSRSILIFLFFLSPPIQTLFFQHNNDLYIFLCLCITLLVSRYMSPWQSFIFVGLSLSVLSYFKLIALPGLFFFLLYRISRIRSIRSLATAIVFSFLFLLAPVVAQYSQLQILSRLATFPTFSSYGLVSFYGYLRGGTPVMTSIFNIIIIIVFFICFLPVFWSAALSLSRLSRSTSNDSLPSLPLFWFDSIVIGLGVYLATSTVMLSFSIRLWCICLVAYFVQCVYSSYRRKPLSPTLCEIEIDKVSVVIVCICLMMYFNSFSEVFGGIDKAISLLLTLFSFLFLFDLCLPFGCFRRNSFTDCSPGSI
jgi:hypothetical protein